MPEAKHPIKVFLCHTHSDKGNVKALYERLVKDGVDAWLDKEKLLPGQNWELEIRKAVRESDVIVVCLSQEFNKAGFRQKEVRLALDTAMEKPEGEIFIIPARLEACETLESLKKWHWVDLFEDNGYDMLMRALKARANSIGATLQVKRSRMPGILSTLVKTPIEANIDTKDNSPRVPSITATKPFKFKKEYLVAIIGAVATIIFAFISSPWSKTLFTQTPTPTAIVFTHVEATPTLFLAPLQPGMTIQHQVVVGDSLFQIARCYGADFEKVLVANPQISDPQNLSSGMIVSVPNIGSISRIYGLPCVASHIVQSGDTWESLAQRYNADVVVLRETNKGIQLEAGNKLIIPLNSAQTFVIPTPIVVPSTASLLSTLFKKDVDILPNQPPDCYGWGILPGQVLLFKTVTSTDQITHVVHSSDEDVAKDTGAMILYGSFNSKNNMYDYCIFNRSSSSIRYTLEVSLSR